MMDEERDLQPQLNFSEAETPEVIGPMTPEEYAVTTEEGAQAPAPEWTEAPATPTAPAPVWAEEPEEQAPQIAAETFPVEAAEIPAASAGAAAETPISELPSRVAEKRAKKRHPVLKTVLIIILCLVVVGGIGAGYLYYHDQQMIDVIPKGVNFYHTSFGGLTKDEVGPKVETILNGLNAQEIDLETTGTPQVVQVKSFVSFDTTSIVNDITQVRSQMSLIQRLRTDWLGQPVSKTIPLPYTLNQTAVTSAVTTLAKTTDTDPVDAQLTLPDGSLTPVITPEKIGSTIDTTATAARLTQAIKTAITENKAQSITVQAHTTAPQVTAADLADTKVIVVSLSNKRMSLYQGTTLLRAMVTATGAPQFATRPGDYFIGVKRYNPTWINPGDDWSKNMPDRIGPGPGNPLGPRAMNVDQRNSRGQIVDFGYRIHAGTTGGGAWSHGCLHLSTSDVLWLYDQVKVGTPVFIRK